MTQEPIRSRTIHSSALLALSVCGALGLSGCSGSDVPDGAIAGTGGSASGVGGHAGSTPIGAGGALPSGGSAGANGGAGNSTSGGSSSASGGSGGAVGGAAVGGTAGSTGGLSSGGSGGQATAGNGQAGSNATAGAAGSSGGGTCTASKPVSANATGSGPHKVTVETNADAGVNEGTIYRPTDLGGAEKYPIFVWGNGACSKNGLSNTAAMAEIASHGYFVIADGTPNGSGGRDQTSNWPNMAKPLLSYITWAVAENAKSCSAYHDSLDTTKIASNGFSCGGLMSEGTAGDPRMTSVGITSSGLTGPDDAFYKTVHTPVLIILGGTSDIAYNNGKRDYDSLSALGIQIMLFSKNIGHGGDLGSARGGDFTKINLAWLNWRLKGDEGATGKGVLVGSGCTYCSDSAWEVKSKNIP
jgi:dienelactone hydrolase